MASRWRFQYCKVVLATSLVWLLFDAVLLMYFADCTLPSPTSCDTLRHPAGSKAPSLLQRIIPLALQAPSGAGEMGVAVVIPPEKQAEAREKFKINQFNLMASDMISVNRTLKDVRMAACKSKNYRQLKDYGKTSVIIVFHNEAWSTLLRTIHSIINRSPSQLLQEIILVDDASERDHLKQKLEEYVATLPIPVHIERMEDRTGLIRARLRGASVAKGKVITFLDSHCECTPGWLEPLLYEIHLDRTAVVCPIIDVISDDTFEYITGSDMTWGGFNWKLNFRWYPVPQREMKRRNGDRSLPLRSPTMAGGLLSIDRQYFYEIGAYDPGMNIWGGENLEMSFRVWMCGGKVLIATCSRVGHVFRKVSPYTWPGGVATILNHNTRRTADVWMDAHKEFYYKYNPGVKATDEGDISARLELRKRLQCKSFQWYLQNIYPESQMPVDYISLGEVRNKKTNLCLDTMGKKSGERVAITPCHGQGGNQVFSHTKLRAFQADDLCLDVSSATGPVKLFRCHRQRGNQEWQYTRQAFAFTMQQQFQLEEQCLGLRGMSRSLTILNCNVAWDTAKNWAHDPQSLTVRHISSNWCLGTSTETEPGFPSLSKCDGSEGQKWLLGDIDWKKLSS